ncbi:MAG: hypothetical protein FJ031_03845 [Chloroflexi bacterium]|nr:hypothetical protein [Chloroflexota bacterium]
MSSRKKKFAVVLLFLLVLAGSRFYAPAPWVVSAQQPTGSIPTVTGTATGMIVRVNFDINTVNIYSGPSSYLYPSVGVLLKGQEIPAIGVSEDRNWIQVYYPGVTGSVGWVYGPYVTIIRPGSLPVLSAPATPSPTLNSVIDPTLAAAFTTPITPTRLPTLTPPAPLVVPTFLPDTSNANRIPMGLVILALGFIGIFGTIISFLRGR